MGHLRLATKTVELIDTTIQKDQGAAYRGWLQKVLPHIGDAYRQDEDRHRSHMGASVIGQECARAIWYNFRWATASNFEGRMLRLFNRGHIQEAQFIAMFLTIGCELYQQDENGNQFRITHAGGHFGGSGDGVIIGLPDLPPGTPALFEAKTHGEKSFNDLAGKASYDKNRRRIFTDPKGVREAKFEHYVQMQIYMRKMGLAVALYFAINKNTDDIYGELVVLDIPIADQFLDRGEKIVWMDKPPQRINMSPGFFKCVYCDHKPVCHLKAAPDVNCRTCVYSMPLPSGQWQCRRHDKLIDKKAQLAGCTDYKRNTDF